MDDVIDQMEIKLREAKETIRNNIEKIKELEQKIAYYSVDNHQLQEEIDEQDKEIREKNVIIDEMTRAYVTSQDLVHGINVIFEE